MNNNPIGVFDSGVGGLTVFSNLLNILPNENYIYFGDTKNLPYGSKTKDELIKLAKNIFDYFANQNTKAVVMACNSTSAITYDVLKNDYDFEIYPIIQIAAEYISNQNISKVGVLSTEATAKSSAYKKALQSFTPNIEVFEQGCPGWVQIVENKTFDDPKSIDLVINTLKKITKHNVEKIILGCTHYPYLLTILNNFANKDLFIDPAQYFAQHILKDLQNKSLINSGISKEPKFVVSGEPEQFIKASELFYKTEKVFKVTETAYAS